MGKTYGKTWRHAGCIIRRRGDVYQVELFASGKRRRQTAHTVEAAEALASKWSIEKKEDGDAALALSKEDRLAAAKLLQSFPKDEDRIDAEKAIELLRSKGQGVDLTKECMSPLAEAVRFYLFHHPADQQPKLLAEVLEQYKEAKKGRRRATVEEYKYKIGRFVEDHPTQTVVDITAGIIDQWLTVKIGSSLPTRRKYLRLLHGFFKFCCAKYKLPENPAKGVYLDTEESDQTEVEAYSVAEVRRIMEAAQQHPHAARIVPPLAIGFFAGLRPAEVLGLNWENVSLDQRQIRVTPATAKRRRQRFVAISDSLLEWLRPYAMPEGSIMPAAITFRRDRMEVLEAAQVNRWLHDGLRHTYGTYHLAAFADANQTANEMGHRGNTDLVYMHYRKLVPQSEGLAFWQIKPAKIEGSN